MAAPRIIHLAETASTNQDAMRLALAGEALPLWVCAARQTAGRGRSGRTWVSIPGNLQASLALETAADPKNLGQLSLVAGVASYEALARKSELAAMGRLRLKWPNDVLIGGAKVAGILVESTITPRRGGAVVVTGFGLNVVAAPDSLDRPVTSLAREGVIVTAPELFAAVVEECDKWMAIWRDGQGFPDIRSAWLARAGSIGEPISISSDAGAVAGTYRGLNEAGALLVDVDGKQRVFTVGDVTLIGENESKSGA